MLKVRWPERNVNTWTNGTFKMVPNRCYQRYFWIFGCIHEASSWNFSYRAVDIGGEFPLSQGNPAYSDNAFEDITISTDSFNSFFPVTHHQPRNCKKVGMSNFCFVSIQKHHCSGSMCIPLSIFLENGRVPCKAPLKLPFYGKSRSW